MICQATYENLDSIPKKFRDEFELKNGKYVLKADAVPGVGALFNSGLEKNKDKALKQLSQKRQQYSDLKEKYDELREQSDFGEDSVVVPKADLENLQKYSEFGSPDEVKKKLADAEVSSTKLQKIEKEKAITSVAQEIGLRGSVLADWQNNTEYGQSIVEITSKKSKDASGKEIISGVIKRRIEENGESVIKEFDLLTEAKSNLEDWKFEALTSGTDVSKTTTESSGVKSGIKVPPMVSTKTSKDGKSAEPQSFVDVFNKERDEAPNPIDGLFEKT